MWLRIELQFTLWPLRTQIRISNIITNLEKPRPQPNSSKFVCNTDEQILIQNILYDSQHVAYYIYMLHELARTEPSKLHLHLFESLMQNTVSLCHMHHNQ